MNIYFAEIRFDHLLFAFISLHLQPPVFFSWRCCSTFEGTWKKRKSRKGRKDELGIIRTNYSDGGVEQVELIAGTRPHGVSLRCVCGIDGLTWSHAQEENKRELTRDGKSAGGAVNVTTKRKITWRNFALEHEIEMTSIHSTKKFSKWFSVHAHRQRYSSNRWNEYLKWMASRKSRCKL